MHLIAGGIALQLMENKQQPKSCLTFLLWLSALQIPDIQLQQQGSWGVKKTIVLACRETTISTKMTPRLSKQTSARRTLER